MVNLSFDGPPEIDLSNPQPGTEVPNVVPGCDDEVTVLNKPSSSTKGAAA
jgi:hypothetical protein